MFRIAAMFVVPVLMLGGLEAGLRLAGYGYDPRLFKPVQLDGARWLVNNDAFSWRFFPPQQARYPGPFRLEARKPAGTCRIFVLGESAAMGDPEPTYAASRYLEALLSARYPATRFEIVNLGITAIDSHVILPIARECARQDGDLWIIYMGNNEMVGPFGAATVFGARAPPLGLIRFNLALQRFRLGQLLVNLGRKLKGGNANAPAWGGMEMFVGNQLPVGDPRKEVVYQNFSRNLDDIVQAGLRSGAKILLNTVAVNLRDCPPFASLVNSNRPPADRDRFDRSFADGKRAENQGDPAAAAAHFASAAALDPDVAGLQYRWARCLLGLTNAAAREHFQRACDDDALPFRADSRINAIIRAEPDRVRNGNLVLCDAPAVLAAGAAGNVCGRETFYEHVHFNFDGNYRLARAWAAQIALLLPASITGPATGDWATQAACEHRLGLTDWNRFLVIQHMRERLQQPPFSDQEDNAGRLQILADQLDQLRPRMNAATADQARADFQDVLQRVPDDCSVRENFALFLQSIGDLPGATAQWRWILGWLPEDFVGEIQLGRLLGMQDQWAEAAPLLRGVVETHPGMTEAWYELGNAQAAAGRFEAALADYDRARRQQPGDPRTRVGIGRVLAKLNRHAEAIEQYRAALRLDPADGQAHFELGGELDAAHDLEGAEKEFAGAARLNPDWARAHFNHGVLLAKLGRTAEARREFEATLRLEPDYQMARTYLDQLPAPENRPTGFPLPPAK